MRRLKDASEMHLCRQGRRQAYHLQPLLKFNFRIIILGFCQNFKFLLSFHLRVVPMNFSHWIVPNENLVIF